MDAIKKVLVFVLCGFSILSYAQNQKFKISLQGGWMSGGNLLADKPEAAGVESGRGWNAGVDINYFVTNHFFVGIHCNYGNVLYETNTWDKMSNTFYRDSGKSTGDWVINNVGLSAGYCLPISSLVNITGQIGVSQFFQADSYPYVNYFPDERFASGFTEMFYTHTYNHFDVAFPVKFGVGILPFKKLNSGLVKNIEIAYVGGWYIEPCFGFFAGVFHGPQLSISF